MENKRRYKYTDEDIRSACETWKQYIDFYYENDMKELKKIVDQISRKHFPWERDMDEIYDIASKTFLFDVIPTYKEECGEFRQYLYPILLKKLYTNVVTYKNRDKRMTYLRDSDGNKVFQEVKDDAGNPILDKNGNKKMKPVRLQTLSLDAHLDSEEQTVTFENILKSNVDVCYEVCGELTDMTDKIELFKSKLSKKQKKIVDYLLNGFSKKEIREDMNMDEKTFGIHMSVITSYENVKVLY